MTPPGFSTRYRSVQFFSFHKYLDDKIYVIGEDFGVKERFLLSFLSKNHKITNLDFFASFFFQCPIKKSFRRKLRSALPFLFDRVLTQDRHNIFTPQL